VDILHRLDAPVLVLVLRLAVAAAGGVIPAVDGREHGKRAVPPSTTTRDGLGLLLPLCLFGLLLVLLGQVRGADEALDAVVVVDRDPLELEVGVVREVVDEEALGLAHDPDARVVVAELDDVQGAEADEAREVLHEGVLWF